MNEEQILKELESTSAKVTIPNFKGKNHIFQVLTLAEEIVPEKSYVKVKSGNIFETFVLDLWFHKLSSLFQICW